MKQKFKAILDDDRGVSPVIGVILMVAITVILAAVIGTFVLGLGDSLQQAPQSTLSVEDAPEEYDTSGTDETNTSFTISQEGGDELTMGDLRIVLTDTSDGTSVTFDSGSWTAGDGTNAHKIAVQKGGNTVEDTTELVVGETLSIRQTNIDSDGNATLPTGEYEIQIIHVPSDSIIKSTTVDLQ